MNILRGLLGAVTVLCLLFVGVYMSPIAQTYISNHSDNDILYILSTIITIASALMSFAYLRIRWLERRYNELQRIQGVINA